MPLVYWQTWQVGSVWAKIPLESQAESTLPQNLNTPAEFSQVETDETPSKARSKESGYKTIQTSWNIFTFVLLQQHSSICDFTCRGYLTSQQGTQMWQLELQLMINLVIDCSIDYHI